jgi:hypothetical protein
MDADHGPGCGQTTAQLGADATTAAGHERHPPGEIVQAHKPTG